jgi:ATP-binding cassette subfamily B multidrug efflux pump
MLKQDIIWSFTLCIGDLRRTMSVVAQDTFLFSESIYENIRFGKEDATLDEIKKACSDACVDEFLDSLPDGYDTIIGERGLGLSGGQKQRLSIARALVKDSSILILYDTDSGEVLIDGKNVSHVDIESLRSQMGIMLQDTFLFSTTIMDNIRYGKLDATDVATSNIDTTTEKLVQKGIKKLLFNRTSFVVAHRLSTIRDCDRIMVIDDGRIVEAGTHEELMALKGLYYDLYMSQYKFLNEGD